MNNGMSSVSLSSDKIETLKKNLTLINPEYEAKKRFSKFKPKEEGKYDVFYAENEDNFYYPRNFFKAETSKMRKLRNKEVSLKLDVTLRDYQKEFTKDAYDFEKDTIWNVPCGHGKTLMAIDFLVKMQTKTLIVVPTHFLVRQWVKRIKTFTDGGLVYLISNKEVIDNSNNIFIVTIDMFKLLKTNLVEQLNEICDLVIFDEAHRMGATTYHPAIANLSIYKRLALTATFRRADGRDKILKYHFGDEYIMDNKLPKATVYPYRTNISCARIVPWAKIPKEFPTEDRNIVEKLYNITDGDLVKWSIISEKIKDVKIKKRLLKYLKDCLSPMVVNVDTYIAEHPRRIKQLTILIKEALAKGRKPLILGKRLSTLKYLHEMFKKDFKSVLVTSELKISDDDVQDALLSDAEVIFGITQLAQEGLDVDTIDTLILIHPLKDTEQAIGRIQRIKEGKQSPIVIYPIDDNTMYAYMFKNAGKFMRSNAQVKMITSFKEVKDIL